MYCQQQPPTPRVFSLIGFVRPSFDQTARRLSSGAHLHQSMTLSTVRAVGYIKNVFKTEIRLSKEERK